MNRRKLHAVIIGLICVTMLVRLRVQAQSADSVSTAGYALDWVSSELHRMSTDHLVWIRSEVRENFNKLEATAVLNRGEWIAAQDASKIRAIDLGTEGKTTWNDFTVWGRFQYRRQLEDSTRLRHQTRINEDAPFYFGSLRKNYYERDVYSLAASVQRSFIGDQLPVTLGLDYRVGNHFSNNDPRGRVQDFQFDTYLAVGLSREGWTGHLKGLYGYGREAVSIGFKNDKYIQNTVDSLYVNWLMNGYGNAFEQIRDMLYTNDMKRFGGGLHVSRKVNQNNTVFANATFVNETQLFKQDRINPLTYEALNTYDRKSTSVELLWKSKLDDYRGALYKLSVGFVQGKDFNYSILKNNYVYYSQAARAHAIWRVRRYQFAVEAAYTSISSEDGLTGNLLEYAHLSPNLSAGVELPLSSRHTLYPSIRIGYNAVLRENLVLPETNSGIFAKTKIYHDYLYYSTPSVLGGASVDFLFGMSRGTQWKVELQLDYTHRTTFRDYTFEPPTTPGQNRLDSNLSVALYF